MIKSSGLLISPLPDMWEGGLWAIALFVCLSACLSPTSTLNLHSADGDTVALCSNLLLRTGGCRFDPSGRQVVLYRVIGMNIFVAFFVLLLLLADVTPPAASSIPLIGLYNSLSQWHIIRFYLRHVSFSFDFRQLLLLTGRGVCGRMHILSQLTRGWRCRLIRNMSTCMIFENATSMSLSGFISLHLSTGVPDLDLLSSGVSEPFALLWLLWKLWFLSVWYKTAVCNESVKVHFGLWGVSLLWLIGSNRPSPFISPISTLFDLT